MFWICFTCEGVEEVPEEARKGVRCSGPGVTGSRELPVWMLETESQGSAISFFTGYWVSHKDDHLNGQLWGICLFSVGLENRFLCRVLVSRGERPEKAYGQHSLSGLFPWCTQCWRRLFQTDLSWGEVVSCLWLSRCLGTTDYGPHFYSLAPTQTGIR